MKKCCDREVLVVKLFQLNWVMREIMEVQMDALFVNNTEDFTGIMLDIADVTIQLMKGDSKNKD